MLLERFRLNLKVLEFSSRVYFEDEDEKGYANEPSAARLLVTLLMQELQNTQ